ncbi:MAG: TRAP transporter substrate-binding protein [Rhodospirillales bacterium]|nr:TRAP transporter substrate-binding protein [Rhodospirillales bacterium]
MQRRKFLKSATAVGIAGAASLPKPALAQGRRELRMALSWPKDFPIFGASAARIAARISALSEGKLAVKVYGAGELVPAFEVFDAVAGGAADLYHSAAYYFEARSRALNFFTTVPFGLTAAEMSAWLHYGGGQELWDEVCKGFNLKPFAAGNTGAQMAGWFVREVNSIEDLKGLKVRMAGLGGDVLRRFGATVVNLPPAEILPAFRSRAIAAAEWIGPASDLALGLHTAAKHYYYPGFHEPSGAVDLSINLAVWNSLAKDQQEMIRTVAAAENDLVHAECNARNAEALDTLVTKHEVKLQRFADPILAAFGQRAGEVMAALAAGDPLAKKVSDSFMAFRKGALRWARYGDLAASQARLLPFKYG